MVLNRVIAALTCGAGGRVTSVGAGPADESGGGRAESGRDDPSEADVQPEVQSDEARGWPCGLEVSLLVQVDDWQEHVDGVDDPLEGLGDGVRTDGHEGSGLVGASED